MGNAVSALFYLWSRTLLNIFKTRLRRIRQPKYLLGAVMALVYISVIFVFPQVMLYRKQAAFPQAELPDMADSFRLLIPLGVLAVFLLQWLWRRGKSSLNFSEAEITHLFPAPVSHAVLVHYSLIRSQVTLVLSAFMLTFFTVGLQFIPSPLWARFIGWWLLMSLVTLHFTASGWTFTRLLHRGLAQWQRQLLFGALSILALGTCFLLDDNLHLPLPAETATPENIFAYLRQQAGSGPLYWLGLPLRLVVEPMLAPDVLTFVQVLVPALFVYALFYYWAFKSEVPDPEAALARAEKRAGMMAAFRKGKLGLPVEHMKARAELFKLGPNMAPSVAILWKNLLSTRDYLSLRNAVVLAVLLVAWSFWIDPDSHPGYLIANQVIFGVAMLFGIQIFILGPVFARQDLRNDLENADVIKTWPLEGWQIVLGELLAPVLILTVIMWLCLLELFLGMALFPRKAAWITPEFRFLAGLSLALVMPFLIAFQLFMANATVVLFPAWAKNPGLQNPGLEVAGQRLLFFAAQLVALSVVLLPALLFGLLVFIPAQWFLDIYALLPAAIVAAVVLAGELAWGINWLGERFDAYDLTA